MTKKRFFLELDIQHFISMKLCSIGQPMPMNRMNHPRGPVPVCLLVIAKMIYCCLLSVMRELMERNQSSPIHSASTMDTMLDTRGKEGGGGGG